MGETGGKGKGSFAGKGRRKFEKDQGVGPSGRGVQSTIAVPGRYKREPNTAGKKEMGEEGGPEKRQICHDEDESRCPRKDIW